eukprot:EG_transcript_47413
MLVALPCVPCVCPVCATVYNIITMTGKGIIGLYGNDGPTKGGKSSRASEVAVEREGLVQGKLCSTLLWRSEMCLCVVFVGALCPESRFIHSRKVIPPALMGVSNSENLEQVLTW